MLAYTQKLQLAPGACFSMEVLESADVVITWDDRSQAAEAVITNGRMYHRAELILQKH